MAFIAGAGGRIPAGCDAAEGWRYGACQLRIVKAGSAGGGLGFPIGASLSVSLQITGAVGLGIVGTVPPVPFGYTGGGWA